MVSEQDLVSRVRNLGEDLFREFSRNGQAILSLHEVDRAINRLSLTLSSNRHTGSVIALYQQTANAPQPNGYRAHL